MNIETELTGRILFRLFYNMLSQETMFHCTILFVSANLIRTFMFLGFQVVVPGDPIVPNASDVMFLAYTIDNYDSDD